MTSNEIKNGIIDELFTPARRNYKRTPIVLKGLNDLFQCDLVILEKYAKENRGYKYLLLCINCFSKKLYGQPLKTRSADEVTKAMKKILDVSEPFKLLQVRILLIIKILKLSHF
jgi:hypothetical protein